MKLFIKVLKIIMLILTGSIAMFLGVFAAISVITNSQSRANPEQRYLILGYTWLAVSIIFYIVPTFLVMLNKLKIAVVMSTAGLVSVLVMYGLFGDLGDPVLYLSLIFITIVILLIAIFSNMENLQKRFAEKERRKNAPAPSVLGGTTKIETSDKKSQKAKKRK